MNRDSIQPGPAALSDSALWRDVRTFYEAAGDAAWGDEVPFELTCSPSLADAYAQLIVRFVQDVVATDRCDPQAPFYVVELGAGSGKLGFHVVARLAALQRVLGLGGLRIVYVLTDVAAATLASWRGNPQLRPLLRGGLLAVARLDLVDDAPLTLRIDGEAGAGVAFDVLANPPVVIANYVFDSLPQDVFRACDGGVEALHVELVDVAGTAPGAPRQRRLQWSPQPLTQPAYEDADAARLLAELVARAGAEPTLFPIAALRWLRRLADAAGGRLALLAADLGLRTTAPLQDLRVDVGAGLFYLPVDLDVIARYLRGIDATAGLHRHRRSQALDTLVSVIGLEPAQLPETRLAAELFGERFGPRGQAALVELLGVAGPSMSPESWLALAALQCYDPRLLDASLPQLVRWAGADAFGVHRPDLLTALERIQSNVYRLPGRPDTYSSLGRVLRELGELDWAVDCYERSVATAGPAPETSFAIALCHHGAGRADEARTWFARTLELDDEHVLARGWIAQLALAGGAAAPPPAAGRDV